MRDPATATTRRIRKPRRGRALTPSRTVFIDKDELHFHARQKNRAAAGRVSVDVDVSALVVYLYAGSPS